MSLYDWIPVGAEVQPRTPDGLLTGVRIPYDRVTAERVIAKGEPKGTPYDDFGAHIRWRHANAMLIWHDRDRLIDQARD
jgi:hypothetical protein